MCSFGFARSMGFALIPLATCCIVANVLLFFPGGALNYVGDGHVSFYPWLFMGVGGGGVAVSRELFDQWLHWTFYKVGSVCA